MMKAKDCDEHSAVILQLWHHLLGDLISADFLTGQKGFVFPFLPVSMACVPPWMKAGSLY